MVTRPARAESRWRGLPERAAAALKPHGVDGAERLGFNGSMSAWAVPLRQGALKETRMRPP